MEEKQEEPCVSAQLGELLQREAELGGAEAGCESIGLLAELAQGLAPGPWLQLCRSPGLQRLCEPGFCSDGIGA